MRQTDIPAPLLVPFASQADGNHVRDIPVSTTDQNAASWNLGFPPNTFVDQNAKGSPPDGRDFNGAIRFISEWIKWISSGGSITFNQSVADAGGYPKGARLVSVADSTITYCSLVDNNTNNPDANIDGWSLIGRGDSDYSDTSNGYVQIGEYTLNFGHTGLTDGSGILNVTFKKPFSVACFFPVAINDCGAAVPKATGACGNFTKTGMIIGSQPIGYHSVTSGASYFWFAFGL